MSIKVGQKVIVRTDRAGAFYGLLSSREGTEAVLTNARRIWYWSGAASLSELAQCGTSNPGGCKFPVSVDEVLLFGIIEVISTTPVAQASIEAVPIWKA